MPNFIQLPQAGSALLILINVSEVRHAALKNNRIVLYVDHYGQPLKLRSRPAPLHPAGALYWYIHAMLMSASLELCPN
ncbi:hypothetical protein EFA69_19475 [Rufibacter immobilis]|uniref:Uncharacterized protein n=1 Tax=Rufibacter immobilis TaxID=1348778 RepID=A0A3M9MRV2_9BACT|nr:hypothetical protein [Rufibacter immobilis]RNI28246.1 hypothetical protein EFA69_19475 [Rufibacter immobilis]